MLQNQTAIPTRPRSVQLLPFVYQLCVFLDCIRFTPELHR